MRAPVRRYDGLAYVGPGVWHIGQFTFGVAFVDRLRAMNIGADGRLNDWSTQPSASGISDVWQASGCANTDCQRLSAEGFATEAMAEAMGVSANTARTHLRRAFDKLDVRDRRELALRLAALKGISG